MYVHTYIHTYTYIILVLVLPLGHAGVPPILLLPTCLLFKSEESRIRSGAFLESFMVGSFGAIVLWDAAFRGLASEGPPELDSILKPPSNSYYSRFLPQGSCACADHVRAHGRSLRGGRSPFSCSGACSVIGSLHALYIYIYTHICKLM